MTHNVKQIEAYVSKAFVFSCIYLLAVIVGGFFILPGVFGLEDLHFPVVIELFLKVTCATAAIVVPLSAVIIPVLKIAQKPKRLTGTPTVAAAITLFVGLLFIVLHGLYVRLRTCPAGGSESWYCQVDGKSYVGMLVLAFFLACLAGGMAWIIQKFIKKQ
ncbi:MAG TPA: hypothetical protein VF733_06465 [Candidatus Saccharimonadales bacterium]